MYDPTIRRFLSADPHVTDPLSGQSYNRYSYVVNNPTNLVDPTGFDWWDYGTGSWVSDGCFGQECGGGNAAATTPFDFGVGGYNGTIFHDTPSGTSGGAVAGGGYGAPLHASEKHRQMSLPTGPAAPAGEICGPAVKAGTGEGKEDVFAGGAATLDVPPPVPFPTTMGSALWNLKAFHGGDISPAGVVISTVRGFYDGVMVPVKDWAVDMHGDGRHRDHSEAMSGALGTVLLTAVMPGGATAAEAVPAITKGSQVTEEMIRAAMKDAPLLSQQVGGISLPQVQANVDKLIAGEVAPAIHVDAGMIVDGNHRYVAGRVFGLEPEIQPWAGGRPGWAVPWAEIFISQRAW
jgi:hypothetical protein